MESGISPSATKALRPWNPTGTVPAPGAVSSFLLRKNLKTGVTIYQFIYSRRVQVF